MKVLSLLLFFALSWSICFSQGSAIERFKAELSIATHDTSRVLIMAYICNSFSGSNPDSALYYGAKALALARKIEFTQGEILALSYMSGVHTNTGDLPKGLSIALEALQIAEKSQKYDYKKFPFIYISLVYRDLNDFVKAIYFRKKAMTIAEAEKNINSMSIEYGQVGILYVLSGQLDSAYYYFQKSLTINKDKTSLINTYRGLGDIQSLKGNFSTAMDFYRQSIALATLNINHRSIALADIGIAKLFKNNNQLDSAIYYAKKALTEASLVSQKRITIDVSNLLSEIYEPIDTKESYRYYKLSTTMREGLLGAGNIQTIQAMIAQEEARQKEIENAKSAYNSQLRQYVLSSVLAILLIVAFFLYRNNQKEKKAKNLLQEKNKEIQSTLETLRSTQAQLIQKEKLASLGELTSGIAHEIQNPLNFVNNFSELSIELVEELQQEAPSGQGSLSTLGAELLSDITQNLQKINHHGKRASSIVKGMLEHSRMGTGERQLTDFNVLCDEYLRLAYHGLRAKDKDGSATRFNYDYELITDLNLPKISVVPQDIGRVLLNLLNNAFYATQQRSKAPFPPMGASDYVPKVTVTTKYLPNNSSPIGGWGAISVSDNGMGIPENILPKIFQPFFTTKPTGEGTGLGLSLAYDIVTKGHGGTIECESVEGEGTTFTVKLPMI